MDKPIFRASNSLSDIQAPKILPTSGRLREEIYGILHKERKSIRVRNLQKILRESLIKYDVTGFAVYSELQDMINEGKLKIDNNELNNDSVILEEKK